MDARGTAAPAIDIDRITAASDHAIHDLVRYLAAPRHRPQLMQLLADSPAWLIAKSRRLGGDQSVLEDVQIAIDSFHDPLATADVINLLRLYAVRGAVQQRATQREGGGLDRLVASGRLTDALDAALVLAEPTERFGALKIIWASLTCLPGSSAEAHANILLHAGDAANEMPNEFLTGQDRANALSWLIDEFLALGENDAAHETLKRMSRTIGDREDAVVRVLVGDARAGRLDAALTLIPGIYNVWQDSKARTALARELWLARRYDDALKLSGEVGAFVRTRVLAAIIEVFDTRDVSTRQPLLDDALATGRAIPPIPDTETENPWDLKCAGLRSLANALASIGDFARARIAADEIPHIVDSALTWSDVAATARRAGNHALARELLNAAKAAAEHLRNRDIHAKLALALAAELSTPLDVRFSLTDVLQALIGEGRSTMALDLIESSVSGDRDQLINRALQATTWSEPERRRLTQIAASNGAFKSLNVGTAVEHPTPEPRVQSAVDVTRRLAALESSIATLVSVQLNERAQALLGEVGCIGESATNDTIRLDTIRILMRFDRVDQALRLIRPDKKDEELETVVGNAVDAGRCTQAIHIIDQIGNPATHDIMVERIVERLIAMRRFDDAISAGRAASTSLFEPMGRVAWNLIRSGEVTRGYELARSLEGNHVTGSVVALHAVGRPDLARELAEKCLREAPGDLELFVQALAGEGLYREALTLAQRHTVGQIRDQTMAHIAISAASVDEFEFALSAVRDMTSRRDQDRVLQSVVAGLQRLGRSREAEAIADTMADSGRRDAGLQGRPMLLPGASMSLWLDSGLLAYIRYSARSFAVAMRVPRLTELSRAYAAVGDFASAINVARDIANGAAQADELQRLAEQLASLGRFDEALALARDIGPAMSRALQLQGLPPGEAEVTANLTVLSDTAELDPASGRVNFPDQIVTALAGIAIAIREAGRAVEAEAVVAEARRVATVHELSDETLRRFARALAALDRWSEAMRTLPAHDAYAFALEVHALHDLLNRLQPGLALDATNAVTRIAGWFDETWKDLVAA